MNKCVSAFRAVLLPRRGWGVFAFSAVAIIAFGLMLPHVVSATMGDTLKSILSEILSNIVWALGKLLLGAIFILSNIAQYNDFVKSTAVVTGWVIVRDVANMFFIVVLLIIAFATILNVSSYQWKQMLPQLAIAAILINFSKTIAGIFIDVSQVVMLTFVNGFAAAAGGNFANAFQIANLLTIDPTTGQSIGLLQVLAGYLLAFALLTIALVMIVILIVHLAFRIVMLWALVVLSPLPYLLRIFPGKGKSYADKWWSEFTNYLIFGPVVAFFIWLALVSVGSGTIG
ncbi:MAG: hypothetical protein V1723_03040, partial [Candidatus Uhrbacteria bacterium]